LSVDTLANAAFLSPRQFSRLFREETGQSPAKAIERLRVESARLMMEAGRLSAEEIAKKNGFGNRERMRCSFVRGVRTVATGNSTHGRRVDPTSDRSIEA